MRYADRFLSSGAGIDLVSTWGRQGFIKSVQTGTIDLNGATSNTATITTASLTNTILLNAGVAASAGALGALNSTGIRITLTNATTVTGVRFGNDAHAMVVRFFVVEFFPGVIRSIQRFTAIELNVAPPVTQAITSVNTGKTMLVHLGAAQNDAGTYTGANDSTVDVSLTSSILVTLVIGTGPGVSTLVNFDVVEFY